MQIKLNPNVNVLLSHALDLLWGVVEGNREKTLLNQLDLKPNVYFMKLFNRNEIRSK